MYQKTLFGLFVVVALTLQGCSMTPKTDTTNTTGDVTTGAETTVVDTTTTTTDTTTTSETTTDTKVAADSAKVNGAFTLKATYSSPGGEEPMEAVVTVANDVVTSVTMANTAINNVSKKFQDMFIAGIAGEIVGKDVKEVEFTHVNGSSLTATVFNKAFNETVN